jgi:Pyruvate/2-oxoacid:ferredoxin oxidoreductase gamma subunit
MQFFSNNVMNESFNIVLVGTGGQGVILSSSILGMAALKTNQINKVRTAETHGMAQRGGTVIVHLRFGPNVESPLVKTNTADAILSFELAETIRYLEYLKPNGILLANDEMIMPPVLFRGQHVKINPELCIGCGNCRINCCINTYFRDPKNCVVISSPASQILNGHCKVLSGCTGCMRCIGICNRNAIQLVKEISYPTYSDIESQIKSVSINGFIIPASKKAVELGDIRMTNIIMVGALLGFEEVPLKLEQVQEAIKNALSPKVVDTNLKALEIGQELIKILKKQ